MKKLKLSVVALSLMTLLGSSVYAQGFVKVLTDSAMKDNTTVEVVKPEAPVAKRKISESVVVEQTTGDVVVSTVNEPVIKVDDGVVSPVSTNLDVAVSVVNDVKVSTDLSVVNNEVSKEDVPVQQEVVAVQPIKKSAPLQNADSELAKRLRKFFVVSDYMIETPYEYGGYLLFRDGIEDKVCDYKKKDAFYMLDHEGGRVNRISSGLIAANKLTPENEDDYYHQWNKDLNVIKEKCVNVILGPTVDISFGDRSYSNNLKRNLQVALPIVSSIERKGMVPVLKHFPGEMFSCYEKYARREVRNCPQGLDEIHAEWQHFNVSNYPALMMSNYIYEKVSPLPAVMDQKIYSYLRGTLQYKGLIVTDALWEMSVPITPKTVWEIFKYVDLMLLINPEQVERMIPLIAKNLSEMPNGTGMQLLEEKEARIAKAKALIK